MALSARASALLASFPRYPYVGSTRTMEYVFAKAGLPLSEPIIAFQQQYAGYILGTTDRLFPGLLCGVVHHKPLPPTRNPLTQLWRLARPKFPLFYEGYRVDDYILRIDRYKSQWFFGCTDNSFEGRNFIDEKGFLYHHMHDTGGGGHFKPSPFASSMNKYIEKEAFRREPVHASPLQKFEDILSEDMRSVIGGKSWDSFRIKWGLIQDKDASDEISQLWFSDYLRVEVFNGRIRFWNLDCS